MPNITLRELVKKIPFVRQFGRFARRHAYKIQKNTYPTIAYYLHKLALKKVIAKTTPLNVVYMVIHESVWKFDRLYWKMAKSEDFNPTIVICPYILQGDEVMRRDMEKAYSWYESRGYKVKRTLEKGRWLNIRAELKPDLMFFTNPHELTNPEYLAKSFLDVLSVYVPYGYPVSKYMNYQAQYNQLTHNLMWKIFTINDMDKQIFIEHSMAKGRNVEVTGYPGVDYLIDKLYVPKEVWKKQDKEKKKIIWAPHHSFEKDSPLGYSTFLIIAEQMMSIAERYSDKLQFSFKPHPLLRDKLYEHEDWGKTKTDVFFEFWRTSFNTQLDVADYCDLFLTSDAIVHDSGSFLAEYLYVNKPAMYMVADDSLTERFSPFGVMAFNVCSHGKSAEDVELFFEKNVLAGFDIKKEERSDFVHNYLNKDNSIPSDKIFNFIQGELQKSHQGG